MGPKRKLFVEIGQRFGRGIVIDPEVPIEQKGEFHKRRGARLVCDCGKEYETTLSNLVGASGIRSVSCGCRQAEGVPGLDITGLRFSRLIAIEPAPSRHFPKSGNTKSYWLCECDCGTRKIVATGQLRSGHTKSCGCIKRDKPPRPPKPGSARILVLGSCKRSAGQRGLAWELEDDMFDKLVSDTCNYCGGSPRKTKITRMGDRFTWNGIDRVDNAQGYIPENVVTCCWICNVAKGALPLNEFQAWINDLVTYRNKSAA